MLQTHKAQLGWNQLQGHIQRLAMYLINFISLGSKVKLEMSCNKVGKLLLGISRLLMGIT